MTKTVYPLVVAKLDCGCVLVDPSAKAADYVMAMCKPHASQYEAGFMDDDQHEEIRSELAWCASHRPYNPLDDAKVPDFLPF